MIDEGGRLGGTEDYLLAAELYDRLKALAKARVQRRQGDRIVYDTMRCGGSHHAKSPRGGE